MLWSAVLACVALPVAAQSQRQMLFGNDSACYLRSYTDTHLAANPAQQVTMIAVGPDPAQTTVAQLALRVLITTRTSDAFYLATAYCAEQSNALVCGVESDGGGFRLSARDGDLRLAVAPEGLAIEGPDHFLQLSGTKGDDRIFRLPPVPADSCP